MTQMRADRATSRGKRLKDKGEVLLLAFTFNLFIGVE
jgi:hypothetical protein